MSLLGSLSEHGERLLTEVLVTQEQLLTKKPTPVLLMTSKVVSLECPEQFTSRFLGNPLPGNRNCLVNGLVNLVNFIFPRLVNCICFPGSMSLPFPSKKYFS